MERGEFSSLAVYCFNADSDRENDICVLVVLCLVFVSGAVIYWVFLRNLQLGKKESLFGGFDVFIDGASFSIV